MRLSLLPASKPSMKDIVAVLILLTFVGCHRETVKSNRPSAAPPLKSYPAEVKADSFLFGMQINDLRSFHGEQIPLKFDAFRLWDCGPECKWVRNDFSTLDEDIKMLREWGVKRILFPLGGEGIPAECRSEQAFEPCWTKHVTEVVTHFKGKIDEYELYNEVVRTPRTQLQGNIAWPYSWKLLATVARETRRIIREIDPEAIVTSPSVYGGRNSRFGREALDYFATPGALSFDVLNVHCYGTYQQCSREVNLWASLARKWKKGLIVTETSCRRAQCPISAKQIAQTYSGQWPASEIYYYSGNDERYGRELWDSSLRLNAAGEAYKEAYEAYMRPR